MASNLAGTQLRQLLLIVVAGAAIGALLDAPYRGALMAVLGYCGWLLYQLLRLQRWLNSPEEAPPEARGIWGEVFDALYRLQRQGQAEQNRLRGLVDYLSDSFASLADGVVMVDSEQQIEWCNAAAGRLLGLRFPVDRGTQLLNLLREPAVVDYWEQGDFEEPLEIDSPHNRHLRLQLHITLFGQGSRLLFVRDITRMHHLEAMRKDFIANVSHELRTPLTVINGYLETFEGMESIDPARWQRVVQQMLQQSRRMENLIRDLIWLSRLETVPELEHPERINVCSMMAVLRDEAMAASKQRHQIRVDCDDSLQLLGHTEELRSAFTNLVMNAVKYTPEGGEIQMRWWADEQRAYFSVIDNGPGIASEHIPRLTERFYRVDKSRAQATGGTGLGLAIVKHVLMRHDAHLVVNSRVGKGSVFSCVFPRERTRAR